MNEYITENTSSKVRRSRILSFFLWILLLLPASADALFDVSSAGKTALFFCLFLPLFSVILNRSVRKHLTAVISLPLRLAKGETGTGTLTLYNNGRFSCRKVTVSFTIRNSLTGETTLHRAVLSAPSHGSAAVSFTFSSSHCGTLEFCITKTQLFDWFGLFSVRASAAAENSILILPETFPAEILVTIPYSEMNGAENENPLRGSDDPSEITSFRNYLAGDPVKRIHWKLSAKRDMPILKEISRPVSQTLLLFWKKTPDTPPEAMDALAEAFSSAALSLSGQHIPFTIGWHDAGGEQFLPVTDEENVLSALSQIIRYGADSKNETVYSPGAISAFSKTLWFSGSYPLPEETCLSAESIVFLCRENASSIPASSGKDISSVGKESSSVGELYTVTFTPDETRTIFGTIQI